MTTETQERTDAQRVLLRGAELIEERGFFQAPREGAPPPKPCPSDAICAFLATSIAATELGLGPGASKEADRLLLDAIGVDPAIFEQGGTGLRHGFRWNDRTPVEKVLATMRRAAGAET